MAPWAKTAVTHQDLPQQELTVYPRRRSPAEIPEQEPPVVAHSVIASSRTSRKGVISPGPLDAVLLQHKQHRRHPSSSSTHSQLARFAQENRRPPSPTGSTRTTSSQQSSYSSLFNSGMSNLRGLTLEEEDRLKLQEDSQGPVRERWERERDASMRDGAQKEYEGSSSRFTGKSASRIRSLINSTGSAASVSSQPATPTSTTSTAGGSMYLPSPPSSPPPATASTTSSPSINSRKLYPPSPSPSSLSITPRLSPSVLPSQYLFPHPTPFPTSPTSSFASSSHPRLTSKSSALSLKSEEQTSGGLRGKAARILGEDIVPSGKAAKVLGVQKEVGGVGRKLRKEMPKERRELVESIKSSPHLGTSSLFSGLPGSPSNYPSLSRSATPVPVAHSRAPPPPPLWLPLPPPAGSNPSSVAPSLSLTPISNINTSSTSVRSVEEEVGEWGARQAPPQLLPTRAWREPDEDEVSGWIDSPSVLPPANSRSHQAKLNLALASLAAVGAARTPQQSNFDRPAPPSTATSKSLSPSSNPSSSPTAIHQRPQLHHRSSESSDVDPALSLTLERQIQHSTLSKGLHLSILSTSSYGLPSDVEFYASPSDSPEEGSPVMGKLPSFSSSGRGRRSGGTTPVEETIQEEDRGPESTPSSPLLLDFTNHRQTPPADPSPTRPPQAVSFDPSAFPFLLILILSSRLPTSPSTQALHPSSPSAEILLSPVTRCPGAFQHPRLGRIESYSRSTARERP